MKRSQKSVTMKDVARAANLSTAAVSLALRDHVSIPEETRQRVRQVAERLGYRKNPLLMALTARRSGAENATRGCIAFLSNEPSAEAFFARTYYRQFYEGARRKAEELGFTLELALIGDEPPEQVDERLKDRDCVACIFGALTPSRPVPEIDWSTLALVKIDSQFCGPETCVVTNDNLQAVRLAYARLRALGYSRIGLATGSNDELATNGLYLAGCLIEAAAQDETDTDAPALHFDAQADFDKEARELANWIREHEIDAVVSNWTEIPERIERGGLKVPADVAVACLCVEEGDTTVAGVRQQHGHVGQLAVETVVAKLEARSLGTDPAPRAVYVKGVWADGDTAPWKGKSNA